MLGCSSKIALGKRLSTGWCGWQKALCSLTLAFDWPNRMINPSALLEVASHLLQSLFSCSWAWLGKQ